MIYDQPVFGIKDKKVREMLQETKQTPAGAVKICQAGELTLGRVKTSSLIQTLTTHILVIAWKQ